LHWTQAGGAEVILVEHTAQPVSPARSTPLIHLWPSEDCEPPGATRACNRRYVMKRLGRVILLALFGVGAFAVPANAAPTNKLGER
jgi:hypothetical protein